MKSCDICKKEMYPRYSHNMCADCRKEKLIRGWSFEPEQLIEKSVREWFEEAWRDWDDDRKIPKGYELTKIEDDGTDGGSTYFCYYAVFEYKGE